jgi:hypothetical protein
MLDFIYACSVHQILLVTCYWRFRTTRELRCLSHYMPSNEMNDLDSDHSNSRTWIRVQSSEWHRDTPCLLSLVFQVEHWGLSHKGLSGRGVKLTFHFYLVAMSRRVKLYVHWPINKVCSNRWSCSCNRFLLYQGPKWLTGAALKRRITLHLILKLNILPEKGGKYRPQDYATK